MSGTTYDNTVYAGIYQKVVLDSTGAYRIDPDSMAHTYSYNTDGTLAYDQVTDGTNTWRKTYGYTSGNMTSESAWVKQ